MTMVPISTYLIPEMGKIINSIHDDHHILCLKYKAGDVQIGITGTVKRNEISKPMKAMRRELLEETGLLVDGKVLTKLPQQSHIKRRYRRNQSWRIFTIPVDKCTSFDSFINLKQVYDRDFRSSSDNIRKYKVGALVHGKIDLLKKKINYAKNSSKPLAIMDNIVDYIFLSKKQVQSCVNYINNVKNVNAFHPRVVNVLLKK